MPTQASPVDRLTNEFLVNSAPDDASPYSLGLSVTGGTDGGFLITFAGLIGGSNGDDESNYSDILGRAFGPGAAAIGNDFLVNTEVRDGQREPVSATLADGRYVVAYRSGDENSLPGTYAASQIVSASGTLVGAEVFNHYTYYNYALDVAALGGGGYVVVSSQEDDFEAQIYAADGSLTQVLDFGVVSNSASSVAAIADGGFELFWVGYAEPGEFGEPTGEFGLYTAKVSSTGELSGPVFLQPGSASLSAATLTDGKVVVGGYIFDTVTQEIVGGSSQPGAVSALDDGGFVLVSTADDGDGLGICAQIYNADGTARGTAFIVNQEIAGDQTSAEVASIGNDDFVVTWRGPDGVWAATFSADVDSANAPMLVNSTSAGDQNQSSITRLTDGRFVVVWTDSSQYEPFDFANPLTEIRAQLYDATGARIGGEFTVNTIAADEDRAPQVSAAPDGGFAVAWSRGQADTAPGDTTAYQRFASDGAKIGDEIVLPPAYADRGQNLAAIGGGRTVVGAQSVETGEITLTIFKANNALAASASIPTYGGNGQGITGYDIAGLGGGGFVAAYSTIGPSGDFENPLLLHIARYATSGALLSDQIVAGGDFSQLNPSVTALSNGGYVVSWSQMGSTGTDAGILAQVYDSAGTRLGTEIRVTGIATQSYSSALADGRFVIAWSDKASGDQIIHSQIFTLQGDASGAQEQISLAGDVPAQLAMGGAGAHGYVISFTDTPPGGDGDGTAIRAEISQGDNLIQGGSGSEALSGLGTGDTIYAGKGDDTIDGNGGDDLIYGEGGADTVHGGAGSSVIYGGFQNDTLFGDAGRDIVVGDISDLPSASRGGNDFIDGGSDDDTLYGDSYVLRAGSFGGRDIITGGSGDDLIYGDGRSLESGATGGADTLSGGVGDDIIYGDGQFQAAGVVGGADRIDGGAGNDSLWGGGGNDSFIYDTSGFGNDLVHDFGQTVGDRDVIDLRGLHLSFGNLTITYADGNAYISALGFGGGLIELVGVSSLSALDFIF